MRIARRGLLVTLAVIFCPLLTLVWLSLPDAWFYRFRYPTRAHEISTVQAEWNAVLNTISMATDDALLRTDETNPLVQVRVCIMGIVDQYYGANRSFDEVIANFREMFVEELHWRESEVRPAYFSEKATIGLFEVNTNDVTLELRREWERYATIYKVVVTYSEPSFSACNG